MRFHEEIYTSAPALLETQSRGNLGIVAKSRGFPAEVERELAVLHSYTILGDISVHDLALHPPRFIVRTQGTENKYFCVSRIVFAGADHTGRTTPLAHHLAFNVQEMTDCHLSPAMVLAALDRVFYKEWTAGPTWIEPLRTLPHLGAPEEQAVYPSAESRQISNSQDAGGVLALAAENLLAFPRTRRPLILCIPPSAGPLVSHFLADVLTLLPVEAQFSITCASHVVDTSDCPRDTAIVFTYPGTRFLAEHLGRSDTQAPVIIDMVHPVGGKTHLPGPYAAVLQEILGDNPRVQQIALARELSTLLDGDPKRAHNFPQVWKVYHQLTSAATPAHLLSAAEDVASITKAWPGVTDHVVKWVRSAISSLVERLPASERWETVTRMVWDTQWPGPVRGFCQTLIGRNAKEALPSLLAEVEPGSERERAVRPFLSKLSSAQPLLCGEVVVKAINGRKPSEVKAAAVLLRAVPPSLDTVATGLSYTLAADEAIRPILIEAVITQASNLGSIRTIAGLNQLREKVGKNVWETPRCRREFCLPLIHQLLTEEGVTQDAWRAFVLALIEVSLAEGLEQQEVSWLASQFPTRLTDEFLAEWRYRARMLGKADPLAAAMTECDLVAVASHTSRIEDITGPEVVTTQFLRGRPVRARQDDRADLTCLSICLALATIVAVSLPSIPWLSDWFHHATHGNFIATRIAVAAIVTCWVTLELCLRVFTLKVKFLGHVKTARRCVAYLLAAVLVLAVAYLTLASLQR